MSQQPNDPQDKEEVEARNFTPEEAVILAVQLQQEGRFVEAKHIYEQVLAVRPEYPEALHYFGVLAFQLSQHEAAIELIRKALAVRPEYPEALNNLGNVLKESDQEEEAIECYQKLLTAMPKNAGVLSNLGAAFRSLGRLEEAAETLEQACQSDPEYVPAHINLGNTYRLQLRFSEAERAYRQALSREDANVSATVFLADVLAKQGKREEADDLLQKAGKLKTSHAATYCLVAHGLQGRLLFNEAVEAYEQALKLDPTFGEAYEFGVRALCHAKKPQQAEALAERWLKACPDNPVAKHMLLGITGDAIPDRASNHYVEQEFDRFAKHFDHVLATLEYHAPQFVAEAFTQHAPPGSLPLVVDAGCGTGLCGPLLRERALQLVGVDLSSEMLRRAQQTNSYDELIHAELTAWFAEQTPASIDAVISADTLVYFGVLHDVLHAMAETLKPGGLLVFTVERLEESQKGFDLQFNGRYRHSERYLRETLAEAGLELLGLNSVVLRREMADQVGGFVVSAASNG